MWDFGDLEFCYGNLIGLFKIVVQVNNKRYFGAYLLGKLVLGGTLN